MRHRTTWLVLSLSVLITVLNALKPPVIDDPAFLAYARQFAAHPERPYDFDYYGKWANDNLVPPVLPAWLALGIPLVGTDPIALKLWLFPILLLFVGSLSALLRRFAPGRETPLLILTVFSPAILPSINLMLDIPVLAFGLSALALYLRAFEKRSLPQALLAGLLAGLAMETKYTAFTLPAVFLAHGYLHRSWRCAIAAAFVAVAFFSSCETWIALVHGDSHFHLAMHDRGNRQKTFLMIHLLVAAVALFGGLASVLWLIGLSALGVSRKWILALLALILGGFILLAVVPAPHDVFLRDSQSGRPLLILNHLLFVPPGVVFLVTLGISARRLIRTGSPLSDAERRVDGFLVLWLLIEIAGYLTISPFPAVRRLLGMLIAATMLIGRLSARTWEERTTALGLPSPPALRGRGPG